MWVNTKNKSSIQIASRLALKGYWGGDEDLRIFHDMKKHIKPIQEMEEKKNKKWNVGLVVSKH